MSNLNLLNYYHTTEIKEMEEENVNMEADRELDTLRPNITMHILLTVL